jgi:ADP-ribosylglycohydrolase
MAGAISGAFLAAAAIPDRWRINVREPVHSVSAIEALADQLFQKYAEK